MEGIPEAPEGSSQGQKKMERIRQNLRMVSPSKKQRDARNKSRERDKTNLSLKRENSELNFWNDRSNFSLKRENTFPNLHQSKKSLSESWNGSCTSEAVGSLNSSLGLNRSLTFGTDKTPGDTISSQNSLMRMSSRKSMTAPGFSIEAFRSMHEDNVLRKRIRGMMANERIHTTPATQKLSSTRSHWDSLESTQVSEVFESAPELEDEERQSVYKARRKSIENTGLWQLASSSAFKFKAMKNMKLEDFTMAMYTKNLAKERMREKLAKKFDDLPDDPLQRVVTLRNNVKHIERRFRMMKNGSTSDIDVSHSMHALQRSLILDGDPHDPKFLHPGEVCINVEF